jgi:hypothetical protein
VIDLDRASLDRVLPATPGPADWDDVISRFGVDRARRRRLAALVAAVLVVVLGTASAFAVRAVFLEKGFIGLPPEGAPPSTPEHGKLVLDYFGPNPGFHGKSRIWVYADGRLVSLRDAAFPEGANPASTGFLEQRLTPEGVQLLRSEILSTGEFGHDPPPRAPPPSCAKNEPSGFDGCEPPAPPPVGSDPLIVPFHTVIQVSGVGRLVRVDRASDLERLVARITAPASWLPASAWEDREPRAYVPSRYAVCYGGWPPDEPIEPSRLLSLLPPAAREMLRGRPTTPQEGLFGSPGNFRVVIDHCSDVTTDEARVLAEAFDDAGFEAHTPALRLAYRFEARRPSGEMAQIYFEPYLPHGDFTCSTCG